MHSNNGALCKVCHGPFPDSKPSSPLNAAPPLAMVAPTCHVTCLAFACPVCVKKDLATYQMVDFCNNGDMRCAACAAEAPLPQSRRGSVESEADAVDVRQVVC